jgi:hypothetical protein
LTMTKKEAKIKALYMAANRVEGSNDPKVHAALNEISAELRNRAAKMEKLMKDGQERKRAEPA